MAIKLKRDIIEKSLFLTRRESKTNNATVVISPNKFQVGLSGSSAFDSGLCVYGAGQFFDGLSGSLTQLTDGTSYLIAGSNVTITTGTNGAITIASADGGGGGSGFFSSTTAGSIFTTGSAAFRGSESGVDSPADKGTDVFFYASGSLDGTDRSLFGGDIVSSGSMLALLGLSGSLTKLTNGTSYLIAGTNITISSASNGAITISSTASSSTSYFDSTTAGSIFTTGSTAIRGAESIDSPVDKGADVFFYVSGALDGTARSLFGGDAIISGSTISILGFSGSLTQLTDGTSYLIAGTNVTITSTSNGAITISSTDTVGDGFFDSTTSGSIFTTGSTAFKGSESGVDSPADKGTDVFFYVSGSLDDQNISLFGGDITASGSVNSLLGLSGSLTQLTDGTSYLIAGTNVTITSTSNGAVTISSTDTNTQAETYWSSTTADSIFTTGAIAIPGSESVDAPSDKGSDVFFYVSGALDSTGRSLFGGDVITSGSVIGLNGISGSLTQLIDGTSYLVAGTNVTITSTSNGSITISSTDTNTQAETYWSSTTVGSIFTTGAVAIKASESGVDSPSDKGTDVFFYVSGALDGTNKSLFGGDIVTSGSVIGLLGLSGSLTQLVDGTSYLIAGTNVTITSESNGAVTINSTDTNTQAATYWDSTTVGSIFTTGSVAIPGSESVDAPSDKGADVFFYVSGSTDGNNSSLFGGDVVSSGSISSILGFTGSLTRLVDGTTYLRAGNNIEVTSGGDGSVTINAVGVGGSSPYWDSTTASSIFTTGSVAIRGSESSIDSPTDKGTDVFFYVSGALDGTNRSLFGGDIVTSGSVIGLSGLSGSLTQLSDGTSYLIAGTNVTIASTSNGAITISSTDTNTQAATYWDSTTAGSIFTTGSAAIRGSESGVDSPADKGTDVFFYVSGALDGTDKSLFGGEVISSGSTTALLGLSGSLTQLANGTSYLIAGTNVTITSESNGAVTINSTAGGGGGGDGFFDSTTAGSIFTTGSAAFRGSESGIDSPTDKGTDIFFYVSGALDGTDRSLFGGDIVSSGSTTSLLGLSGSLTQLSDGTSYLIAGTNVTITSTSNGAVTINSTAAGGGGGGDGFFDSTTAGSIFTTGSAAFVGAEGIDSPADKGTDVFFYVSGSEGSKDSATAGTSLFGGDVVVSGSLYGSTFIDRAPTTVISGVVQHYGWAINKQELLNVEVFCYVTASHTGSYDFTAYKNPDGSSANLLQTSSYDLKTLTSATPTGITLTNTSSDLIFDIGDIWRVQFEASGSDINAEGVYFMLNWKKI